MKVTKEAFEEWKTHPVTVEIFAQIGAMKADLLEDLANGMTLAHRADITHGLTSKLVGQINGLDQLLGIDFVDEESSTSADAE